jgi:hypothetical protein
VCGTLFFFTITYNPVYIREMKYCDHNRRIDTCVACRPHAGLSYIVRNRMESHAFTKELKRAHGARKLLKCSYADYVKYLEDRFFYDYGYEFQWSRFYEDNWSIEHMCPLSGCGWFDEQIGIWLLRHENTALMPRDVNISLKDSDRDYDVITACLQLGSISLDD